jgi:hypothetical protein
VSILQWLARLCGLALFLLVLVIAIGEGGPPNPLCQPPSVAIQLALMLVMTLGLVVAWRWEVIGAVATLAALVAFNLVNVVASGRWAGGAFPLFAIPALLYLAHGTIARHLAGRVSLPVTK